MAPCFTPASCFAPQWRGQATIAVQDRRLGEAEYELAHEFCAGTNGNEMWVGLVQHAHVRARGFKGHHSQ